VKGAHTGNQDPTNLVFTGTINNKNAITERSYCAGIIVIRVMMTYRNDRCCRTSEIETNRTMIGIADDRTITTANSETGVTEKLYFWHRTSLRFLVKTSRIPLKISGQGCYLAIHWQMG
jgi:hypothetical protein